MGSAPEARWRPGPRRSFDPLPTHGGEARNRGVVPLVIPRARTLVRTAACLAAGVPSEASFRARQEIPFPGAGPLAGREKMARAPRRASAVRCPSSRPSWPPQLRIARVSGWDRFPPGGSARSAGTLPCLVLLGINGAATARAAAARWPATGRSRRPAAGSSCESGRRSRSQRPHHGCGSRRPRGSRAC